MSSWRLGRLELEVGGGRAPVTWVERPGLAAVGPPIVYLHGLGSSGWDFVVAANAPELRGRRLIAPDFPGSGRSRLPGELEVGIDDLVVVVQTLLEEVAPGPVHLIGHSMGGLVGLLLASRRSEMVASFVNVEGNLASIDCRVFSRRVATLAERLPAADVVDRLAAELETSDRVAYSTFAGRFRAEVEPRAFVHYCRSIVEVSDREPLLDIFRRLDLPRMFVHGVDNRDLPYLDELRRSGVEVAAIEHSDHFPLDSNPRRFFEIVGDFLSRRAPR